MRGFITENEIDQAECVFPGIRALYLSCAEKPRTFLDLLTRYLCTSALHLKGRVA